MELVNDFETNKGYMSKGVILEQIEVQFGRMAL